MTDDFSKPPKSQAEERNEHVYGESAAERIEREESRFWRFGDWAEPVRPR